jgi:hypothetical protein
LFTILGFATCQDTDLSESEESFESEFNIKYHSKDEEKRAGQKNIFLSPCSKIYRQLSLPSCRPTLK